MAEEKHCISFEEAEVAFLDPSRVVETDESHSTETEPRFYCHGKVEECVSMRTAEQDHRERPDIFAPDGYEWEDAPAEFADSIGTGTIMPADFLPPPEELVLKVGKKSTTLRIDSDVLAWFQSMGKGYQTRINAVLRAYKAAHEGR